MSDQPQINPGERWRLERTETVELLVRRVDNGRIVDGLTGDNMRRVFDVDGGGKITHTWTKVAEVPEPPHGSVVFDKEGDVWQRDDDLWYAAGQVAGFNWSDLLEEFSPIDVLHVRSDV